MSFLYKQILVTPCRIKMQNLIFVSFIDDKRIQNPHISQRLFQVEGVANYAIEGPSGDVSIDEDELPVLGTLSVEEM